MNKFMSAMIVVLASCIGVSPAHAVEFNIPNTQGAIVYLSTSDGSTIETYYIGRPNPTWSENADVFGLDPNISGDPQGIPICFIQTRDNATGTGDVTVSAVANGIPLSLTFTVNVTDGAPVATKGRKNDKLHGGGPQLIVTLLEFIDKPN